MYGKDSKLTRYRFGTYTTSDSINAGLDLEMPGPSRWRKDALVHAVGSNKVAEHVMDERARNVLKLVKQAAKSGVRESQEEGQLNTPEDQKLLRRAAAESVVLLKNKGGILPFDSKKTVAVIGPSSKISTYCGGGSASLFAYYAVTPFEGVTSKAKDVQFAQGAYSHKMTPLIGNSLKTPDGKTGFIMRVYNEPPEADKRECIAELHQTKSECFMVDYYNPKFKSDKWYADIEGTYTPEETGTYDFGVTVQGTAKLFIDDELVVDNATVQRPGEAFFGGGTVEEIGSKQLEAGKSYKYRATFGTTATSEMNRKGVVSFGPGGIRLGCVRNREPEEMIAEAEKLAASSDQVVLFAGLSGDWESEGYDRPDMDLPAHSDELISRVLKANPKTVIVTQSGTPVTMPWADQASAQLHAWYGGNETGNGIADVLFGDVNPVSTNPSPSD